MKVMKHTQFKESAYRHLISCKQMLKDINVHNCKKNDKTHLQCEVFYLSGYIVELMLSYAVCSCLNIHDNCEESTPFKEDKKYFKVHNLKQKYNYALKKGCSGLRGLDLLSKKHIDNNVQQLFDSWDISYRYVSSNNLPLQSLPSYIEVIEGLYNTICNKYTI